MLSNSILLQNGLMYMNDFCKRFVFPIKRKYFEYYVSLTELILKINHNQGCVSRVISTHIDVETSEKQVSRFADLLTAIYVPHTIDKFDIVIGKNLFTCTVPQPQPCPNSEYNIPSAALYHIEGDDQTVYINGQLYIRVTPFEPCLVQCANFYTPVEIRLPKGTVFYMEWAFLDTPLRECMMVDFDSIRKVFPSILSPPLPSGPPFILKCDESSKCIDDRDYAFLTYYGEVNRFLL